LPKFPSSVCGVVRKKARMLIVVDVSRILSSMPFIVMVQLEVD